MGLKRGLKRRLLQTLVKKKLEQHSDAIQAEIERVKGFRSLKEIKEYGLEKGDEFKALMDERCPNLKERFPEIRDKVKSGLRRVVKNRGKRTDADKDYTS